MNSGARIPFSRWRRAQVLRLREPLDGVREGWFAFLERGSSSFTVCRLGEDEEGELRGTDETHEVHVDFAECFKPTLRISGGAG
ncbi:hypothetical protein ACFLSJ_01135 [Verrucomicrobiota bacterium]